LDAYLLTNAIDNAQLVPPPISPDPGPTARSHGPGVSRGNGQRPSMGKRYDPIVVEAMMYMPRRTRCGPASGDLASWMTELTGRLNADAPPAERYQIAMLTRRSIRPGSRSSAGPMASPRTEIPLDFMARPISAFAGNRRQIVRSCRQRCFYSPR